MIGNIRKNTLKEIEKIMEELKPLDYDKKKIITANKTPTETVDINREKKSKTES